MSDNCVVLPDGSAFATASFPLPTDHWLYATDADGLTGPPPMSLRMADGADRRAMSAMVEAAARYALRASTHCGKDIDLDPDALVQNMVVGLLGYHTPDGTGGEAWMDPTPLPPLHGWYAYEAEPNGARRILPRGD